MASIESRRIIGATKLTRAGKASVVFVVLASIVFTVSIVTVEGIDQEKNDLRTQVAGLTEQLGRKASTESPPADPATAENLKRLTELNSQLTERALGLAQENDAALQAAKEIPEFRSPQYREPFDLVMKHLQDGKGIALQIEALSHEF